MEYLDEKFCKQMELEYEINETPSFTFYTLFFKKNDLKLEITIRDYSKDIEKGVLEFITFLKNNKIKLKKYDKISNLKFKNLKFNALIIYENFFENPDELDLNKYTVFPIYECEFSGNETSDELFYLRRNIVNTIDWRRKKTPMIKMRFENLSTGVHSIGSKFQYFTEKAFYSQLKSLRKTGSFLEVKNYKNDYCKVVIRSRLILLIINNGKMMDVTKEYLFKFFDHFFCDEDNG